MLQATRKQGQKNKKTRSLKPAMPPIRCLVPSPDVTSGCCVLSFSTEVRFLQIFLFLGQMPTVHDEPLKKYLRNVFIFFFIKKKKTLVHKPTT